MKCNQCNQERELPRSQYDNPIFICGECKIIIQMQMIEPKEKGILDLQSNNKKEVKS